VHQTVCFDALGFVFRVGAGDVKLTDYLAELFADLTASPAAHVHDYVFRVTPGHGGVSHCDLTLDGRLMFNAPAPEQLVGSLVRDINRRAIDRCEPVALHAGGVERDGLGLAFPGRMEAGKTTLVTGLVRAGMGYLTDEAVAVDPETLLIRPYPKPLSLDPGAWALFPELEPNVPLATDEYKQDQWQVPSAVIRPGALGRSCPVGLVVFPRFAPGATTALEPLRRAEALVELAKNTFGFEGKSRVALDLLADVVRRADCYRLTMGYLDEAVSLLWKLVGSPTSSRREAS
jgi:hypothetical protein